MKIIISPAKRMEECQDLFAPGAYPEFLEQTKLLYEALKAMEEGELGKLFRANAQITRQNYLRYQEMCLERAATPALLSYVGIQFQSMAPKVFSYEQWEYVKTHLRILSGFYGILRPDDRITPYRLEMQARLSMNSKKDLYDFWGDSLCRALLRDESAGSRVIVNLASKEYSRSIEPYLSEDTRFVTCVFGTTDGNRVKMKASAAKIARGTMVRYMAGKQIEDVEEIKHFSELGYRFSRERSTENCFVYLL